MPYVQFDVNKTNFKDFTQFLKNGFNPNTIGDNGWLNSLFNLIAIHVQLPPSILVWTPKGVVDSQFKGYIKLNQDQTFGNTGSGATLESKDYENLFTILWESDTDNQLPVHPSKGSSSSEDWLNLKRMTLPNLEGKIIVGYKIGSIFSTLFSTVGSEQHTLTDAELPKHSHKIQTYIGTGNYNPGVTHDYTKTKDIKVSTETDGGQGNAHNNVQPSMIGTWWIKY